MAKRCGRLEAEVLLQRSGVGICYRHVARLHRNEFLVSLEVVVMRQDLSGDEFLLQYGDEVEEVLR